MRYRQFGQLDWQVSILGFGTMRLPVVDNQPEQIDEERATEMLRWSIDQGVNYLDTAYPYHGGRAESFLARALRDGYAERVRVATKLPCWLAKSAGDFDRLLDEQLERLQRPSVDFYLLHALNSSTWSQMRELGVLDWAERAMAQGKFGAFGFSFHDKYEAFEQIVDGYDNWTLCQIQYNLLDEDYQAGTAGLRYAAAKGLAVVVMEPLRGGLLARRPPPTVQAVWDSAAEQRSPVEWALRWVWNHAEVSVALSGMGAMEQVVENVALASQPQAGGLSREEVSVVERAAEAYRALSPVPCTGCCYCMPCPQGVNIPRNLEILNESIMYEAVMEQDCRVAKVYYSLLSEDERASSCVRCGACEELCPQNIPISDWLERCQQELGSG